ncbi:hypothetical protein [Yersinia phage vB_YenP_ISAO8]|uniref:Internal virion protein n=1 Tax=Yersinia phage vB_YenP_ISAO8 TaxID=1675027 RepID=A0A0H4THB4_9CAUD|nr:internal virion protein [Yersinia phage vB_YenP_ISAO8]AKQ07698.1 hypothetical protein [Yersinia phage vB_YenP_ISAO8]
MWVQIAMAAINMIEGAGKASSQRKLAKAQYKLDSGRADRADKLRQGQNEFNAATANLQRIEQSLNNQRLGRIAEREMDQSARNYTQVMDGLASDKFSTKLQSMNNIGQMAASAAAAGVAGGSIEQVEQVERLRAARVDNELDKQGENAKWAKIYNDTAIQDNLISQTDTSGIFADIDYTAKDLVFDNSWQHKYGLMDAAMDGMNGFSGNMDKVGKGGINLQSFGYSPSTNIFGSKGGGAGTGTNNKMGGRPSLIQLK